MVHNLIVCEGEKVRGMEERKHIHNQSISIVEIMQLMTHDSLLLYKKKGSRAPIGRIAADLQMNENSPYSKGVVFVSPSKADLTEGKGYVVTSYETLQEKNQQLTHWTPNTYRGGTYYHFKKRLIKGHTRDNLKQINVIGLDIDSNEADIYGLYLGCEELGLPRPNLLLQTPRGFQVFFILATPFYIHKKEDYKALRVAERLSQNIRQALAKYAPVDTNCVPFGFYRIPREDNVLDFSAKLASTSQLLVWSKKYEAQHQKKLHVLYNENAPGVDYIASDWYQAIIHSRHIDKGHTSASRNNALLTLALANYASERSFEAAYDELDQFNSHLYAPLTVREFEKTLKSAYSGKYKGVKREYVDGLLELWTEGNVKFQGKQGWYKFKKERKERQRSHYNEWEEDIISYIATHQSSENPYLQGSLNMLAKTLGMALSSLKEVLKRSCNLITKTVGRGRNAYTLLTSRQLFIQHLLTLRKRNKQQALQELLEEANPVLKNLSISNVMITEEGPIGHLIHTELVRNTS